MGGEKIELKCSLAFICETAHVALMHVRTAKDNGAALTDRNSICLRITIMYHVGVGKTS